MTATVVERRSGGYLRYMSHLNVEIKARCGAPEEIRAALLDLGAERRGTDHQVDTYFNCRDGRLKLRQGEIETALIQYRRPDTGGPKRSQVGLYQTADSETLKALLTAALGVLVVVDKNREIYFIGNVKFHIDSVARLGSFVEIEAIDFAGVIGEEELTRQCAYYQDRLRIVAEDLVGRSYSDMILELTATDR